MKAVARTNPNDSSRRAYDCVPESPPQFGRRASDTSRKRGGYTAKPVGRPKLDWSKIVVSQSATENTETANRPISGVEYTEPRASLSLMGQICGWANQGPRARRPTRELLFTLASCRMVSTQASIAAEKWRSAFRRRATRARSFGDLITANNTSMTMRFGWTRPPRRSARARRSKS